MAARLYGVGVGPGDPELMTLKALRIIKESQVLVFPNREKDKCVAYGIISQLLDLTLEEKIMLFRSFPMTKDAQELEKAQSQVAEELQAYLDEGKQVAFLTIGDPSIYSTYQYVQERVNARGYETETISGVPSFCAVAARLGIALGEKEEELHILPGSYDVKASLGLSGTRIYMKSGKKLKELKELLEEYSETKPLEVWSVSNCGLETEAVTHGIAELKPESGYLTIVIVKDN